MMASESAELALSFYREMLRPVADGSLGTPCRSPLPHALYERLIRSPDTVRFPLPGQRVAVAERVGGQFARWRLHVSQLPGEQREIDARELEDHLDLGAQWKRALAIQTLGCQLLELALERLPTPIALLEHSGRVAFVNRAARRLLVNPSVLRIDGGRLWVTPTQRLLDGAFLQSRQGSTARCAASSSARPCTALIELPPGAAGDRLYLEAEPVSHDQEVGLAAGEALWLVSFYPSSSRRRLSERALRDVLGLTPCETAVVKQLFSGCDLAESAVAIGITRETAKKHLGSIFRKCEVRSQAQLLQRLALGPFFRHET